MPHRAPLPNVQEALEGLRYPATADEILICAKAHRAAPEMLELLREIPERQYDNLSEVQHVLGKVEELTNPEMTYNAVGGSQELEDEAVRRRAR